MKSEVQFSLNYVSFPAKGQVETLVAGFASHCEAADIHWCDGSEDEYRYLCQKLVQKGTFIKLNAEKRPGCFACFSHPSDVARIFAAQSCLRTRCFLPLFSNTIILPVVKNEVREVQYVNGESQRCR